MPQTRSEHRTENSVLMTGVKRCATGPPTLQASLLHPASTQPFSLSIFPPGLFPYCPYGSSFYLLHPHPFSLTAFFYYYYCPLLPPLAHHHLLLLTIQRLFALEFCSSARRGPSTLTPAVRTFFAEDHLAAWRPQFHSSVNLYYTVVKSQSSLSLLVVYLTSDPRRCVFI